MLLIPYKSVYDFAADLNGPDSRREGSDRADRPSRVARLLSIARGLPSRIASRPSAVAVPSLPRIGDVAR